MLKKKLKKVFNILETLVFLALVVIFVIVISPILPFKNIPRTYIVVSGSMEPTIKTGSVAFTIPTKPTEIKIGDIIAFASPMNGKDVILHRVFAIKSTAPLHFQTKGDSNNSPDNWDVMDVSVLGKEVFSIPYLGNAGAFMRKPLGFIILIVIPALLIIVGQIFSIKKSVAEEVDKKINRKLKEATKTALY